MTKRVAVSNLGLLSKSAEKNCQSWTVPARISQSLGTICFELCAADPLPDPTPACLFLSDFRPWFRTTHQRLVSAANVLKKIQKVKQRLSAVAYFGAAWRSSLDSCRPRTTRFLRNRWEGKCVSGNGHTGGLK